VLSRRVGGLQTARTLRALVRMGLAGLGTFLLMALVQRLVTGRLTDPSRLMALLDIALVGTLGMVTYLVLARAMRVTEVTEMVAFVRRRLPGGH
jgi:putative peptidoglycan lipid II flippase